jgi:hypothetical protein
MALAFVTRGNGGDGEDLAVPTAVQWINFL